MSTLALSSELTALLYPYVFLYGISLYLFYKLIRLYYSSTPTYTEYFVIRIEYKDPTNLVNYAEFIKNTMIELSALTSFKNSNEVVFLLKQKQYISLYEVPSVNLTQIIKKNCSTYNPFTITNVLFENIEEKNICKYILNIKNFTDDCLLTKFFVDVEEKEEEEDLTNIFTFKLSSTYPPESYEYLFLSEFLDTNDLVDN